MSTQSVQLRIVPGPANTAKGAEKLPARLKLLNWGVNPTIEGPVILDEATAACFAANQTKIGRERVALDFEHNTTPGAPEYERTTEPRKIAAQGRPIVVAGDGLYLEDVTWTQTGASDAQHFEDVSPTPFLDASGRVIGLHSAALTRTGAVHGLTLAAATAALSATLATLSAGMSPAVETDSTHMNDQKPAAAPDMTAILQRLDALETANRNLKPVDVTASLQPLSARLDAIEGKLTNAATAADQAERDRVLAEAAKDGKLIPLSADALKTVPTPALKELVEKLPKNVVPMSASKKPGGEKPELQGLSKVAAAINAQIGAK